VLTECCVPHMRTMLQFRVTQLVHDPITRRSLVQVLVTGLQELQPLSNLTHLSIDASEPPPVPGVSTSPAALPATVPCLHRASCDVMAA
jgi:hypothetical protein